MNNIVHLPALFQHFAFETNYLCVIAILNGLLKNSPQLHIDTKAKIYLLNMLLGEMIPQNHEKI